MTGLGLGSVSSPGSSNKLFAKMILKSAVGLGIFSIHKVLVITPVGVV